MRVYWDEIPVDMFFAADEFHDSVARRRRMVPFAGRIIRVLCAEDLAVFKAMVEAGSLDVEVAALRLASLLTGDARLERLRHLGGR